MELPTNHVSCRSLETEYPKSIKSVKPSSLCGPSNSPILLQAVSFTSGPWGVDVRSNVLYTKKREAFLRWQNEHTQREKAALQPGIQRIHCSTLCLMATYNFVATLECVANCSLFEASWQSDSDCAAQLLRETAWYDPTQPSQQLKDSARWGSFIWRDQPVLGKEYVVNRHKFGVEK